MTSEKNADENPIDAITRIQTKIYFFISIHSIKDIHIVYLYYGVASGNS